VKLSLERVAEYTGATGEFDDHAVAQGYSIDSRTLKAGDLFFAVKGERLDGHEFVEKALAAGAVAAVVAQEHSARFAVKTRLLVVADTLRALQTLGSAVRRCWNKALVGVTGSAGKTTTKEAIAHVLAAKFKVLKSEGNLNNHFGLPLQLLRLEPEHEIAVIEMGMSHAGEIAALARLAAPDIGVVTNVAPVHLGFFNSVAEIARAKYELIESLTARGTAMLNADDEYVSQFGRDFKGKVVTYGIARPADVFARNVTDLGGNGSRFELGATGELVLVTLPLIGRHNIYNALAAAAVARERGISFADVATALGSLRPADKRGQLTRVNGVTVINDCYNSNPKALESMLDALAAMPAERRIAVAGEMLELGPAAPDLHHACGRYAAQRRIDIVLGVRGDAQRIVDGARAVGAEAHFVATPDDAGAWLAQNARPGDVVLLKASRGVKLERALEVWQAQAVKAGK
jgi:UDP-N-acetylmuramoyl-tripeptide--D-alanyl-D-alanine ligase